MPVITHYVSQSDTRSSFSMPASGYMERATGLRMLAVGYFVAQVFSSVPGMLGTALIAQTHTSAFLAR